MSKIYMEKCRALGRQIRLEGGVKSHKRAAYSAKEVSLMLGEKDAEIERLRKELETSRWKKRGWQKIGWMRNREAIYCSKEGEIAIEKDHQWLVSPNDSELREFKGKVRTRSGNI